MKLYKRIIGLLLLVLPLSGSAQTFDFTADSDDIWTMNSAMPDYDLELVVEYEDIAPPIEDEYLFTQNSDGTWTMNSAMPNCDLELVIEYEDGPVEAYDLWIAGTQVTSTNLNDVLDDGTVSYDLYTKTLTLNRANIHVANDDGIESRVSGLKIKVVGANYITSDRYHGVRIRNNSGDGTVTLLGNGSLYIKAGNDGFLSTIDVVMKDGVRLITESKRSKGFSGWKSSTSAPFSSLTMYGYGTTLRAKGSTAGSIRSLHALNLNNYLEILEPEGATFKEDEGILVNGKYVQDEWVTIANPSFIDGIEEVKSLNESSGSWYDLQGRKLSGKPAKGIYIKDGKKILVK